MLIKNNIPSYKDSYKVQVKQIHQVAVIWCSLQIVITNILGTCCNTTVTSSEQNDIQN